MIKGINITKSYNDLKVLKGVDIEIQKAQYARVSQEQTFQSYNQPYPGLYSYTLRNL